MVMQRMGRWALYLAAAVVVIVSVFPFVYAISTSLKSGTALFESTLWPKAVTLDNYRSLFTMAEQPFGKHILNSIVVSMSVVILSLFLGVTAAYALGRIAFKGRGLLLTTVLAVSMFPQVAVLYRWSHQRDQILADDRGRHGPERVEIHVEDARIHDRRLAVDLADAGDVARRVADVIGLVAAERFEV